MWIWPTKSRSSLRILRSLALLRFDSFSWKYVNIHMLGSPYFQTFLNFPHAKRSIDGREGGTKILGMSYWWVRSAFWTSGYPTSSCCQIATTSKYFLIQHRPQRRYKEYRMETPKHDRNSKIDSWENRNSALAVNRSSSWCVASRDIEFVGSWLWDNSAPYIRDHEKGSIPNLANNGGLQSLNAGHFHSNHMKRIDT